MRKILRAEHIYKAYEDKQVLRDISITLGEGELVSILGVSGVGKTTLFNVLSGLVSPDKGKIYLRDNTAIEKDTGALSDNGTVNVENSGDDFIDITGKTGYLSYMMQKDLLLPHKTVIENAALPLILAKMPKKKALEIAGEHFAQFGIDGTKEQYPSKLSGGMRQRAALLRTYLCGKKVALLDEPFSALDTITRVSMQQWYLEMMKVIRLSSLFITHDVDEAIMLSDRIYIMKGNPAEIVDEIMIEEDKPRTSDFMLTEKFLEYKRMIRSKL